MHSTLLNGKRVLPRTHKTSGRPKVAFTTFKTAPTFRVYSSPDEKDNKSSTEDVNKKLNEVREELKLRKMTPNQAKEVLKKWKEMGAKDPDSLRKAMVKGTLQPVQNLIFQTFLDAIAAFGGFAVGNFASQAEPFPGKILFELFGYFCGWYYGLQVALELSALVTLGVTAYKLGTRSAELLIAVQEIAGPGSGLAVVDKAQLVVNTVKLAQTLDSILEMLKDKDQVPANTLERLSALLTLIRAQEKYGFEPEKYGLDQVEAGKIALVFSRYDVNDNMVLEQRELKDLCSSLGKDLTDEEVKEALKLLNKSGNDYIKFEDFVAWWATGKRAEVTESIPS